MGTFPLENNEMKSCLTRPLQLEERIEVSLEQDFCPLPGADIKSTTSAADLTTTIYHVSSLFAFRRKHF